jgi:UDP-2-acetamido-3-amino-2,3-dideoxy-glucuronate N-acetyltransferase
MQAKRARTPLGLIYLAQPMPPIVHPSAELEQGADVGDGTRLWRHVHVMRGAVIGRDCVLGQNCFVANNARIGDRCRIQNNVSVYAGVELGDDVFVGPSAVFTNVRRPRAAVRTPPERYETTLIGAGATIGANATIVCGVRIGPGAFIGAGAVVTCNIPAYAMALGVPAKVLGWVCACGADLSRSPQVPQNPCTCPACGKAYRASSSGGLAPA